MGNIVHETKYVPHSSKKRGERTAQGKGTGTQKITPPRQKRRRRVPNDSARQ